MESMQTELNNTKNILDVQRLQLEATESKLSQLTKQQVTQQTELNQTRGFIQQQRTSTGFDLKEVELAQNETGGRLEETSMRLNDTAVQVKILEEKLRNVSDDLSAVKTVRGSSRSDDWPAIKTNESAKKIVSLSYETYENKSYF